MSLSSSQLVVVHDLDYLKHMSRLVDDELLKDRFAEARGPERSGWEGSEAPEVSAPQVAG